MPTLPKRPNLYQSEEGALILEQLQEMERDPSYRTEPSFCSDSELYPDNKMPFIDYHMTYLQKHKIDYQGYISNLRLMLKIRP